MSPRRTMPALELCQVNGVPVRAHLGALVVLSLVTWSLARSYFPVITPGSTAVAQWVGAAVAACLLGGSLVAHELAHALVAKASGVAVRCVTLHLLGGASELTREPPTAAIEVRVAAAGPAVSFGIALICVAVDAVLSGPAWLSATLRYVGMGNLVLGAFNLLPAYPLDGGRLLRAVLWAGDGRIDRATALAKRVSAALAVGLIALGGLEVVRGALFAGVWLALIGAFVLDAARPERRRREPAAVIPEEPPRARAA